MAVIPGIFQYGANRAIVQNQDYSLNTSANPAVVGSAVVVYLTGIGATTPGVADGIGAPSNPLAIPSGRPTASIGGVNTAVLFIGLSPGFAGLAQAVNGSQRSRIFHSCGVRMFEFSGNKRFTGGSSRLRRRPLGSPRRRRRTLPSRARQPATSRPNLRSTSAGRQQRTASSASPYRKVRQEESSRTQSLRSIWAARVFGKEFEQFRLKPH